MKTTIANRPLTRRIGDSAKQSVPSLKFHRLVAASVAASAVVVAVGAVLSHWHTGSHGLDAAAVAAVAALAPLLLVGYMVVAAVVQCNPVTTGRMFVGLRLTTFRFAVAFALLVVGCEIADPHGGATMLWFALLYITLLTVEARWLAGGLGRSAALDRKK